MKCLYIALLLITVMYTQTISGTVINSYDEVLQSTNVYLQNTQYGTMTNDNGEFLISDIPDGKYTLIADLVGYRQYQVHITIPTSINYKIKLEETPNSSDVVVVSASRRVESIDEVPSSISVISIEKLKEEKSISTNISQILSNSVPGLAPSTNQTSNTGQTLRGRGMLAMIDGIP